MVHAAALAKRDIRMSLKECLLCLPGTVAIISSGTSDELVAEECRATADVMGCYCFRLSDVSVDGLHRILHNLPGASSLTSSIDVPIAADPVNLCAASLIFFHSHTIWHLPARVQPHAMFAARQCFSPCFCLQCKHIFQ